MVCVQEIRVELDMTVLARLDGRVGWLRGRGCCINLGKDGAGFAVDEGEAVGRERASASSDIDEVGMRRR